MNFEHYLLRGGVVNDVVEQEKEPEAICSILAEDNHNEDLWKHVYGALYSEKRELAVWYS